MKKTASLYRALVFFIAALGILSAGGCAFDEDLNTLLYPTTKKSNTSGYGQANDYYNKFYKEMTSRKRISKGTSNITALEALPKDTLGQVNWTVAVVEGMISPRSSITSGEEDEFDLPLDLNIFIEAKTPLMANVLFPHSIHTYWLSCNNCHPKIFIPEAGANPISMNEIWEGQWCGRCHGKVAFDIAMPRDNCVRCHVVLKEQSLERERWK